MENRQLLELESISGPTIIIDAKDVVTFQGSKYAAEHIPNAAFVVYEIGGHLLVGYRDKAKVAVSDFVRQHVAQLLLQAPLDP